VVDADFIFSNLKQKLARKTKKQSTKKQNRKSLWGGSNIEK
jgi:hypothetical protein